jgi:hypothetical protein
VQIKITTSNKQFFTPTGKIWSKSDNLEKYWKAALLKANIKYRPLSNALHIR